MFARQLFFASHQQASLRLRLQLGNARPTIELHRGWICAIDLRALDGNGLPRLASRAEDQLAQLLALEPVERAEETPPPAVRHGDCQPFHPAPVLRRHYDGRAVPSDQVEGYLRNRPLVLTAAPHPSGLQPDERRVLTLLSARPTTLAELYPHGHLLPERLHHLAGFLLWLGALEVPSVRPALIATLGLPETADDEALRRGYRERVRALHPDLNPISADEAELVRLNQLWEEWEREAAITRRSRG